MALSHPIRSAVLCFWQSTVEQCFLVEQPQGTLVVVDYELPQFAKQVRDVCVRVAASPCR